MTDMRETGHLEDYVTRMKPSSASNLLLWLIAGFFLIFLIWASLTKIDRTVRGQGRIAPISQLQTVSNPEGGVLEAILVKTGDIVRQGVELVRLDRTASGAEFGSNQTQYDALRARIARLNAEVNGRTPVFPATGGPTLGEQLSIERSLYTARVTELNSLTAANTARIVQAERAVAEARATAEARASARDAAQSNLTMIRPLVQRGIEPRMSLTEAENKAAVANAEYQAASASISRALAGVSEARASLAQQRQDWRSRAATDLAAAQAEMAALRRTLPALSERVARTSVRAPLDGRINRVLVTTVGAAVTPGAPLVEIVPSNENLLVETAVRPADIGWVRMNQEAQIRITAYNSAVYGSLKGRVVAISPDATVNEKTGESFYNVRVTTNEKLRDARGMPLEIGPGMVAEVSLLGDKRSVLQYILTPLVRMKDTAFREE